MCVWREVKDIIQVNYFTYSKASKIVKEYPWYSVQLSKIIQQITIRTISQIIERGNNIQLKIYTLV